MESQETKSLLIKHKKASTTLNTKPLKPNKLWKYEKETVERTFLNLNIAKRAKRCYGHVIIKSLAVLKVYRLVQARGLAYAFQR